MIKPHYERHVLTKKHLAFSALEEQSESGWLSKAKYDKDMAEVRSEIQATLTCLEEYKQIVAYLQHKQILAEMQQDARR